MPLRRSSRLVAHQRGSHRNQLVQFDRKSVKPDSVDAIVVPTSRQADLLAAVGLASRHNCVLLVLCSKWASVVDVELLAVQHNVELVAIDIDQIGHAVLPSFATDRLLADTHFGRDTDLSFKRNLALVFSLLAGWQRIVFLDDDIDVPEPDDLWSAAGLLRRFPAVGLGLAGFPDNSVVCHANRAVGRRQETFIGGGAMAVAVSRMSSFFPNIYNEDWFFLVGERRSRKYGVVGRAVQAPYDPYRSPDRARSEELGDCLAEGLYALLDIGQYKEQSASEDYWTEFLAARRALIREIASSVDSLQETAEARKRMGQALSTALARCEEITPAFCVAYLAVWRADRMLWSEFVLKTWRDHPRVSIEYRVSAAILTLGLTTAAKHVPVQASDLTSTEQMSIERLPLVVAKGLQATSPNAHC
jgi:hypothetical protein